MLTEKLINLNVDLPAFQRVFTPAVKKTADILKKYGFETRVVGGAVRDFVQGKSPRDIDFATDADPSELIYVFQKENIPYDDKGISHGTIKAVFGNEKVDVTSIAYKIEMKDGKPRIIKDQDWEQDAQHRDLTMNSLSVGNDGILYDYTGGLKDIQQQIVRMTPVTRARLQDDPHIILRWFKALGSFDNPRWPREDYVAIKAALPFLKNIKGEEKTDREISSIITSKHGQKLMRIMCKIGAAPYLGISCDLD